MTPYVTDFDPPAPVIEIEIYRSTQPTRRVRVRALLDTGADICAVPQAVIAALDTSPDGSLQIASYRDAVEDANFYQLDFETEHLHFRRIKFVESQVTTAILGRNALNKVNVFLYGTRQAFEIQSA